jgi:2-phospho-L-lactate guanylyltransferase
MRTAAILPVKRFAQAKRRLGASVGDPLRHQLARAMVADVLSALGQTASIERTIVVTREHSVAVAARRQGALVVRDAAEEGQSAAVALGVRRALAEGMERVLCIPGDCPALDPAELEALLRGGNGSVRGPTEVRERMVVVVPDRHGSGTNGLMLTPPDVIAPSFGPDSCQRHRALALAAGVEWRIERPPSLLLDIDTGADLAALRQGTLGASSGVEGRAIGQRPRASWSGGRQRAARTHALLGRPDPTGAVTATSTA